MGNSPSSGRDSITREFTPQGICSCSLGSETLCFTINAGHLRDVLLEKGTSQDVDVNNQVHFTMKFHWKNVMFEGVKECIDAMMGGTRVIKIHRYANGKKRRQPKTIVLDEDQQAFRYLPTKKGKSHRVQIRLIKRLLYGENCRNQVSQNVPSSLQFLVTWMDDDEIEHTLGFITHASNTAHIWFTGLKYLIQNAADDVDTIKEKWLLDAFDIFDPEKDGALPVQDVLSLLSYLNIQTQESEMIDLFHESNTIGKDGKKEGKLTQKEFNNFFDKFQEKKFENFYNYMRNLYKEYIFEDEYWSIKSLKQFLEVKQLVSVDDQTAKYIISKYEPLKSLARQYLLSLKGLISYLLSSENDVIDLKHNKIHQDMNRPLSHYYISSSHNTYLLKDQLRGPSSTTAYINALRQGCRCVELDCWDGPNNEPIIYHGHTWTSKILFKDVIQVIAEHAFTASDYPLILSLENHCSVEQQTVMASHLINILKEKLYTSTVDENLTSLPSPSNLKRKILIKGKKLPKEFELDYFDSVDGAVNNVDDPGNYGYVDEDDDEAVDSLREAFKDPQIIEDYHLDDENLVLDINIQQNGSESPENQQNSNELTPQLSRRTESRTSLNSQTKTSSPRTSRKITSEKKTKKSTKKLRLAAELSCLVNYVQSTKFVGFEKALKDQWYYMMSSLSESKLTNYAKSSPEEFCMYNQRFLTRTYPNGSRVDSSNYNPIMGWKVGCQIVALNYQTNGVMMDVERAMFRQNGGCGYVLKPNFLLNPKRPFNATSVKVNKGHEITKLQITVISGHLLNDKAKTSFIDPYVSINIYGVDRDIKKSSFKTSTIQNNGFKPYWNETFEFTLHVADLAFIRFAIYDEEIGRDDFILQNTLSVRALRKGFRRVGLKQIDGTEKTDACLLVFIENEIIK